MHHRFLALQDTAVGRVLAGHNTKSSSTNPQGFFLLLQHTAVPHRVLQQGPSLLGPRAALQQLQQLHLGGQARRDLAQDLLAQRAQAGCMGTGAVLASQVQQQGSRGGPDFSAVHQCMGLDEAPPPWRTEWTDRCPPGAGQSLSWDCTMHAWRSSPSLARTHAWRSSPSLARRHARAV